MQISFNTFQQIFYGFILILQSTQNKAMHQSMLFNYPKVYLFLTIFLQNIPLPCQTSSQIQLTQNLLLVLDFQFAVNGR